MRSKLLLLLTLALVVVTPSSVTAYTKVDAGKVVKAKTTDFKADLKVVAVVKGTSILSIHLLPVSP